MKENQILIDVTSTAWETCSAWVEANSLEEAIEKFEESPFDYDWDGWETWDTETRHWEIRAETWEVLNANKSEHESTTE